MRWQWLLISGLMTCCAPALADQSQQIDELVKPLIEGEAIVGCVVGVIEDGRQEVRSYGTIERGGDQRPDGKTIYEIGSVTKAFTGILLADMVERGLVELDAPLQNYVPDGIKVPVAKDQPITLLHLATHTSGLPRLPANMKPANSTNPYADYSSELMYAFLKDHELRRPPGEYEYSNYGMGLLGQILAERAGKSYESLVIERICVPLAMNDTRLTLGDDRRKRLAPPHNGEGNVEHNWDFQAIAGAGALRSTCDDLLKLLAAGLSDDESSTTDAIHLAWEKRHGKPGDIGVGLGWHLARDDVSRWHNGQTGGYSSFVGAFPPKKVGVVVLSNTATDQTTILGEKILQALLGMDPEPIAVRKAVEVDPAVLKRYVGRYALSPFFVITVTEEDGKLMAQATAQEKFQIFPSAENEFFYKVVDAQISFVKDKEKDDKVTKLILHQNGMDQTGVKIESK